MSKKGLIYVMDMQSTLSNALVNRMIDMNQYLIFRRWDMDIDPRAEVEAYKNQLRGIIISGSGRNINSKKKTPPDIPSELFNLQVPILAICYGLQLLAHLQGVKVVRCWDEQDPTKQVVKKDKGEQGPTIFHRTDTNSVLFQGLGKSFPVWMKHNWMADEVPEGWTHTGYTEKCPVGAMEIGNIFAL